MKVTPKEEKWTGYTTTNYEEEKVKKDKL